MFTFSDTLGKALGALLKDASVANEQATADPPSPGKEPCWPSFLNLPKEEQVGEVGKTDTWASDILKWLMEVASGLIKSVTVHSKLLIEQRKDSKEEKAEVNKLKDKVEQLEKECDEVRQRGMKGNLLLSSPVLGNSGSLLHHRPIKDKVTGAVRNETYLEACLRALHTKTGVRVPEKDISACHPLRRQGAQPFTNFVIRFSNLLPGSAWDIIASGLLQGKNPATGQAFSPTHLYINFQLTPRRSELARLVREKKRSFTNSMVDANGRIRVKIPSDSFKWHEIASHVDLEKLVTPAVALPRSRPLIAN